MGKSPWKILLVEDDEDDFVLLRHMLSNTRPEMYDLDWARTFKEGWDLLRNGAYDAVLMDYFLGPQSGVELTRKAIEHGFRLPIILLTGHGSYEIDLEAMQAGVTLYLTKDDISPLLLERSIRYAIEIKQKENELRLSRERLKQELTERKKAEEALLQSQNEIRRLVATSYEGIWSVDRSGKTTFINHRAAEILGYTMEEIEGTSAFEFLMSGEEIKGRQTLAKIAAGESGRVEAHACRKDGGEAVLLVSYSPIIDESGEIQGALAMFTDITERIRAEQAVQKTSEQLKEYAEQLETRVIERTEELVNLQRQLVENVEAERLWVSQDLHDGPMQEIYGLIYKISLLENVSGDPAMQAEIGSVIDKLKQINEDLRTLARELRPTSLTPFGLEKAIREHIERFDLEHPDLHLSLDLMADGKLLPEHVRLSLFRIYQTALTNVIRHAEAKNISIRFSFDLGNITLEIQDDGKGFEVPKRLRRLVSQGHYGLAGAVERAEAIGGKLEVESAVGEGTLLRVIVPLEKEIRPDLKKFQPQGLSEYSPPL